MFDGLKNRLNMKKSIKMWRKINVHNTTKPGNQFDINSVVVGKYTYGTINVLNWGEGQELKIGNYCSIAQEVMFILNADHYTNHISTFPFKVKCMEEQCEGISKGDIIVDDDVWFGYRSTIMSGVHIGQGGVIAAGAVVTNDIPPYAIAGGVPAKVIKYRFSEDIVKKLLKLDYSKLSKEQIEENLQELYLPIDSNNIDSILRMFNYVE